MTQRAELEVVRAAGDVLEVRIAGAWRLQTAPPSPLVIEQALDDAAPSAVRFDLGRLVAWDSALVSFLSRSLAACKRRGIAVQRDALPAGITRLLALAEAVPEKADARADAAGPSWLSRTGLASVATVQATQRAVAFVGEAAQSLGRLAVGRARFRGVDLWLELQQAGVQALPIVTLISFLVGTIMAFVGAVALAQFGATIYVANMVTVAMVREMGAMMTAVIMAGRTGSAYAAQLGTMNVSQEIDALVTMGLPPIDFLVLPRLIALSLMLPVLCVYSNFVGMIGGGVIAAGMMDLTVVQYWEQTKASIWLSDFFIGVGKSVAFGAIVAVCGCLQGISAGRSAAAVGDAATSAVVTAIVAVIVADGLFSVVFHVLGI